MAIIFARNFRGFKKLNLNVNRTTFLVGDNSSGKTSILSLISSVYNTELASLPRLDPDLHDDKHDFFSPYFENADVTIGYLASMKAGGTKYGRVSTIEKAPFPDEPLFKRYTVFKGDVAVTLKKEQGDASYRIAPIPSSVTSKNILALHDSEEGFESLKSDDESDLELSSFGWIARIAATKKDDVPFVQRLFQTIQLPPLPEAGTTGPVRGFPERFYSPDRQWHKSGKHFPAMWRDLKRAGDKDALNAALQFGQESQLFEGLDVESLSDEIAGAPLLVTITKRGKKFALSQVGFGVSQVIPIIVEALFDSAAKVKPISLLQQPELHLHPIAQAALGEFLFKLAAQGSRFIVETHSDFLIDRFRANMRENKGTLRARVLYCTSDSTGNHCQTVGIDPAGELIEPPAGYKDFFVAELARTL